MQRNLLGYVDPCRKLDVNGIQAILSTAKCHLPLRCLEQTKAFSRACTPVSCKQVVYLLSLLIL